MYLNYKLERFSESYSELLFLNSSIFFLKNSSFLFFSNSLFQKYFKNKILCSSLFHFFYNTKKNHLDTEDIFKIYPDHIFVTLTKKFSYWYNDFFGRQKYNPYSLKRKFIPFDNELYVYVQKCY